jgi:hypothetical protein
MLHLYFMLGFLREREIVPKRKLTISDAMRQVCALCASAKGN